MDASNKHKIIQWLVAAKPIVSATRLLGRGLYDLLIPPSPSYRPDVLQICSTIYYFRVMVFMTTLLITYFNINCFGRWHYLLELNITFTPYSVNGREVKHTSYCLCDQRHLVKSKQFKCKACKIPAQVVAS